jgi:ComF family protein
MMDRVQGIWNDVLHTIFPDLCMACDKLPKIPGAYFCLSCLHELPYTDHFKIKNNSVKNRFAGRIRLQHAGALFIFREKGPIQHMLHKLKYRHKMELGVIMGEMLAKEIMLSPYIKKVDVIIPVPIHNQRKKERGYNQCEIIAQSLSQHSGIPVISDALIKHLHNESQTGKNRGERMENVHQAYQLNQHRNIAGLSILVVDDVVTTGATVESCCLELLRGQPSCIYVAALAAEE